MTGTKVNITGETSVLAETRAGRNARRRAMQRLVDATRFERAKETATDVAQPLW